MYREILFNSDFDLKLLYAEKINFADLVHFLHSVLEMGQVLFLELMSPALYYFIIIRFIKMYLLFYKIHGYFAIIIKRNCCYC